MGVINIVTDIALILLPLPILRHSRLPLRQKIQLGILFGIGIIVVIITTVRLPLVVYQSLSIQARTTGATIEILGATIVANAAFYFALLKDIQRGHNHSSSGHQGASFQSYNSEVDLSPVSHQIHSSYGLKTGHSQYLDKTALSFTAIMGLRDDLHLSGSEFSWASSIYYFGYLVASYPAGMLMVRWQVGKTIALSMFVWGGVLLATAGCRNAESLLVVRFFLGVTESAIAPGLSVVVSMWYKRSEQPLRNAAWFIGNTFAGILGGLLAYAIGHINSIPPWQAVFFIFGGLTLAWSICILLLMPDTPMQAWFFNEEDRAKAVVRVKDNMTGIKSDEVKWSQCIEALMDIKTWLLAAIMICVNIPNKRASYFVQLFAVLLSTGGSSYLANTRTYWLAWNFSLAIVGASLLRQLPDHLLWGRYAGKCLTTAAAANFPLLMSLSSGNVGGFTKKTTVNAVVFIIYCTGNIIGPQLFIESEAPSYTSGFLAIMICYGMGIVFSFTFRFYLARENRRRDRTTRTVPLAETFASIMSDLDSLTPRVFLMRHGETEWAKLGRYTGTTDIELTPAGIQQVSSAATTLVGASKLLDPSRIAHVFVSPRTRAKKTFELLLPDAAEAEWRVTYTEDIAEWDYGEYEGLKTGEIRELRKEKGLDREREWNIWRDGCEGGESMEQVAERLDGLILEIRKIQKPYMNGEKPADVVLVRLSPFLTPHFNLLSSSAVAKAQESQVSHGLILRCFFKRWLGWSVDFPFPMMLNPGAMAVLSYKNNNINEPALHVGMALPSAEEGGDMPA
ncbi:hypothetical protein ACJZ2D_011967 [Fusarium nematophilum]